MWQMRMPGSENLALQERNLVAGHSIQLVSSDLQDSSTTYQITKALRDMCHLQQVSLTTFGTMIYSCTARAC